MVKLNEKSVFGLADPLCNETYIYFYEKRRLFISSQLEDYVTIVNTTSSEGALTNAAVV
jgi:hypothetical protein